MFLEREIASKRNSGNTIDPNETREPRDNDETREQVISVGIRLAYFVNMTFKILQSF